MKYDPDLAPYLERHKPKKTQFRARRAVVRPVVVIHTAESGTDTSGADEKAEGVANYCRTRTNYGSYHLVGDHDSILRLVPFDAAAFGDGTGSNEWAVHISGAMNAGDWARIYQGKPERRQAMIDTFGEMAAIAARWMLNEGLTAPRPVLLSKEQSNRADASGFISHARRDPTRRSDPGTGFPWPEFFRSYQEHLTGETLKGRIVYSPAEFVQAQLQEAGLYQGSIDGDIGPLTKAAASRAKEMILHGRAAAADTRTAALGIIRSMDEFHG